MNTHVPVLLEEVLEWLAPTSGKTYVDGTLGHGGHASALLARTGPNGRLLGIERDPRNLAVAHTRLEAFGPRAVLVRGTYADLGSICVGNGFGAVDGVLFDLGFSSAHVDDPTRGFSFSADGPLDMRYDPDQELTAATIVNGWSVEELARLFRLYGEEPAAERYAKAIVVSRKQRRFVRTSELADVILSAAGGRGKIHPATRVFQALRIAVNDELGELERVLPAAVDALKPGGRLAVISFHSLEDRIVKQFLLSREDVKILTKRPIVPTKEEALKNPRSRSAKLRVVEKK